MRSRTARCGGCRIRTTTGSAGVLLGTTEDFTSVSKDGTEVHGLIVKPAELLSRAASIPRCCASMAVRTGRTSMPSASSVSCSRPTATSWWRSTIGAATAAAARTRRRSSPTGATRKSSICSARWTTCRRSAVADPDRLGIGGWSYGGILTNYAIATRRPLQGGDQRRRQLESDLDVRHGHVHHSSTSRSSGRRGRTRTCGSRCRTRSSTPTGFKHPDAVHGRREGLQRAAARQRADVPGAAQPRRRYEAGDLSRPVPRHHTPSYRKDRFERYLDWYGKYLLAPATTTSAGR